MIWKCTDELPDALVNRPLAALLVRVLQPTPVSPDAVTSLAMICGVSGAAFLACGFPPAAGACLLASLVLDCADGQLARARGGGTELGRILDGAGDYVVGLAVHLGLLIHLQRLVSPATALALTAASGLGMAMHALILDYHKNRFWGLGAARPARRGLLVRLYDTYVRIQETLAGAATTSSARVRAAAILGPTARLWIIAAMAIHPLAIAGALLADLYLIGLLAAFRITRESA